MESSKIQSVIMRRVYYTYVLSIFTHVMFFQGVFLSVAAILLARWLHVASIVHNFLSVPVGRVPAFVSGAFSHAISSGESIMLVTFILAGLVSVSVGYKLAYMFVSRLQVVSQVS